MLYSTHTEPKVRLPISETSTGNHGINIYSYGTIKHNDQCTYLNSGLLAPCEYILHGLVLRILNPAPAPSPEHASCCHSQLGV
jgi:hypothetical protein